MISNRLRCKQNVNIFHLVVQANQSECWTKGKHFERLIIPSEYLSQRGKQLSKAACIPSVSHSTHSNAISWNTAKRVLLRLYGTLKQSHEWKIRSITRAPELPDSSGTLWDTPLAQETKLKHVKARCLPE